MTSLRGFGFVYAATIAVSLLVYAANPALKASLFEEDGLAENLTAATFLGAFLLAARRIFATRDRRARTVTGLAGLIGLAGFLDEVSFGRRVFDIRMPRVLGLRIDGVHDLFYLSLRAAKNVVDEIAGLFEPAPYPVVLAIVASMAVMAVAVVLYRLRRHLLVLAERAWPYPPYVYLLVTMASGFVALLIDLHRIELEALFVAEEALELNAALALIMCVETASSTRAAGRTITSDAPL